MKNEERRYTEKEVVDIARAYHRVKWTYSDDGLFVKISPEITAPVRLECIELFKRVTPEYLQRKLIPDLAELEGRCREYVKKSEQYVILVDNKRQIPTDKEIGKF